MIKKTCFTTILTFATIFFVQAQKNNPESAFKYNLVAEPAIVEVSDNTTLNVKFDNGTIVNNYPNERSFPNGVKPAYAIGEYKILQGGGKLKFNNAASTISFTYSAPASIPKSTDQTVVQVSVELIPKNDDKKLTGGLPKIILYCTLYIVQNETAFELVMPEAGFDHTKFISNNPGGAAVLPIDSRIPPAQAAKLQQQIDKMKKYQTAPQIESNVNFNGITSNASLFYDEKNDLSTIKFTQLGMQINKEGEGTNSTYAVTAHPNPVAIIVINFKGKPTKGSHNIVYLPTGVTFASVPLQKACECGHEKKDDKNDVDAPCAGQVIIKEVTKDGFRGECMARMYFANNGNHTSGYVTGKFYVLKANNN
jgi:hypothetical protein